MTIPSVEGQFFPTLEQLRDVFLRSIAAGGERLGLTLNVLPGSEYYLRATACAQQVTIAFANQKLAIRSLSPLDATGDALKEIAGVFGVVERPAGKAAGFISVGVTTGSITIPAGFVCQAANGIKYETVTSNIVSDGSVIEIIATTGGSDTNLAPSTVLKWTDGSIGLLKQTATADGTGITGGVDADTEEVLRQRLLAKLAAPETGGNWSFARQTAENASASVEKAFVYSGLQGAGSYSVAIVAEGGDRTLSPSIVSTVETALVAEMPGHAVANVTSVTAEYVDVVVSMNLPLPIVGGGVGGGWRDAVPWPNNNYSQGVKITSFPGPYIITSATALNGLVPGAHIGIWSFADSEMKEFTVASASVSGGFVRITVNGGFPANYTGHYISAGAENLVDYASELYASFNALGPGEKTSSVALLPRSVRRPTTDSTSPSSLTSRMLADVSNQHDEIISIDWVQRYATGTTTTKTSATVPAATTDPPNILVMKYVGFQQA